MGFEILSLRASMSQSERTETIDKFNNADANVHALVTSLKVSSFGLNLQSCCSKLIIMAVAPNVNTVIQIIGRLHRLGQSSIQKVWIVTQARSYDNFLQFEQANKMVTQLAGEAAITVEDTDDPINDDDDDDDDDEEAAERRRRQREETRGKHIRRECAEMVRQMLGQRESRAQPKFKDMDDLQAPWYGADTTMRFAKRPKGPETPSTQAHPSPRPVPSMSPLAPPSAPKTHPATPTTTAPGKRLLRSGARGHDPPR